MSVDTKISLYWARSHGDWWFQRDDKWHAFRGGSKQPVRQLSNKSERQSADLMTCSYSPSFHQSMCVKKKSILGLFLSLCTCMRGDRSIMMIVLYFPLRVVDYLEAFTLPERQIGGRSRLIVIQCHKGRHTSCQERNVWLLPNTYCTYS